MIKSTGGDFSSFVRRMDQRQSVGVSAPIFRSRAALPPSRGDSVPTFQFRSVICRNKNRALCKSRGCLKRRPLCCFDFFLICFVYFVEKTLKKISTKNTKEESKVIGSTFQTASLFLRKYFRSPQFTTRIGRYNGLFLV